MTFTDLHAVEPTVVGAVAAAAIGAFAGGRLVERGLAQLEVTPTRIARRAGHVACGLAGPAAVLAARQAGSWWLAPALLVWAFGLAVAATCDALTQRVPTPLVRHSALVVSVLIVGAAAASGHWRWVAFAAISAAAAGVVFGACWRFLGIGFGDVRLAVLGGLGLVKPTPLNVFIGVVAFTAITLTQAGVTLSRGGTRHTTFAYGPAIATTFVVIATV